VIQVDERRLEEAMNLAKGGGIRHSFPTRDRVAGIFEKMVAVEAVGVPDALASQHAWLIALGSAVKYVKDAIPENDLRF
jgi:hypothetical protein